MGAPPRASEMAETMAEMSHEKVQLELTQQQQRVLEGVMRGERNREIAKRLGCSVKNIDFHVSNILRKAGQPNRVRLVLALTNAAAK